jgi:hypothetical protein
MHKMIRKVAALVTLLLGISLMTNLTPVFAAGSVESSSLTCSSLSVVVKGAVGLVDSIVVNITDNTVLIPGFSQQFAPDANGFVSYTVTFPEQDFGDELGYDIYEEGIGTITIVEGEVCGKTPGRAIPTGFVLRTITCDVAVFDSPSGNPVGSNKIINGQTWYINPTPVSVSNNALYPSWTEVFVSGTTNGFIPTKCVAPFVFPR